jgi:4-hydroxythreonine-4-phosphate dehydrogenase
MSKKPVILITSGDSKGIGPEITKKALEDHSIRGLAEFFVFKAGDKTGFDAIERAVKILKNGGADGLVTAPVNKAAINKSGIPFKGHTEYLAGAVNAKKFAMMFSGGHLKITLVTRHIPLKDVSRLITSEKIKDAVLLTNFALKKYFKINNPKIGVAGLNPHCGESGLMGIEEEKIIIPAVKALKRKIPRIQGPLPADVIFYKARKKEFDAVVAMYHDQGLGPFKMIAFDEGVNVTLGLPFVRTSPDHGTAYDIAGKDIADPKAMKEAVKLAVLMCGNDNIYGRDCLSK